MMEIAQNISLLPYNTFGIDAKAKYFVNIDSLNTLKDVLKSNLPESLFILGGGSNMLLTKNIDKIVLKINIKGITIVKEDEDFVWVEVNAGEIWHDFVLWCIENNYGGIENLSLIPGNVGATPIQNIGAYGVEVKDVIESCKGINMSTKEFTTFSNKDCQFGYRESIFKNDLKNQYIITSVIFKLTKHNHILKTGYGAIQQELEAKNITTPTIKDISDVVIAIRQEKLPNPKEIGNSGSFFKNPIISKDFFDQLIKRYPAMPHYVVNSTEIKIPAGWLIEQAGFKGYRLGDAGVHNNQALVLVNYGNATGEQLKKLADTILQEVKGIFGIDISPEVNIF
ncbi:UDP-N-acetylmuramate dehydrogenase [Myroides injenensis]|uniref:UDP-N-acetylmuramate dehydrogenase n=1 Tax=Myroides injenensis TaxID=1183151 RepID=UPI0021CD7B5F|nr:UDP-N-acetylmuramate dehydrogenase [Myroides injenensis]